MINQGQMFTRIQFILQIMKEEIKRIIISLKFFARPIDLIQLTKIVQFKLKEFQILSQNDSANQIRNLIYLVEFKSILISNV